MLRKLSFVLKGVKLCNTKKPVVCFIVEENLLGEGGGLFEEPPVPEVPLVPEIPPQQTEEGMYAFHLYLGDMSKPASPEN